MSLRFLRAAHRNSVYMPGMGDFTPPDGPAICWDCLGEGKVTVLHHDDKDCEPVEEKEPCPFCGGSGHIE